jgi:hypothetical protein
MTASPSRYYSMAAHLVGWLMFFSFPLLLSPHPSFNIITQEPHYLESLLLRNFLLVGLFYFNQFYLTPEFLQKRNLASFLFLIILLVVVVSIFNLWIHEMLTGPADGPPPEERMPPPPEVNNFQDHPPRHRPPIMIAGPLFSSLLTTIVIAVISTMIVIWNDWQNARENERQRSLQKIAAELSVLKLQISPHFLFNTLNNIRWLVRSKSDQAENAVVKLSQLLRYILYQTNDDKVSLKKEVEHLEDFIDLQLIRLENKQAVKFSRHGAIGDQVIVPLLFIPIVENFFKYGDFEKAYDNEIVLDVQSHHLKFMTKNKIISQQTKDKDSSGIGLDNLRKRLSLHYNNNYILKTVDENGYFKVEMEIILN